MWDMGLPFVSKVCNSALTQKHFEFVSFCSGDGGNDFAMSLWKRSRMFLRGFRPGMLEMLARLVQARSGNQRDDDVDRNKD